MKYVFLLTIAAGMVACGMADKKAGSPTPATDSANSKPLADTANFTTIQWLDSTYKDLGKIKEGQVVEVTYHFKNSGTKNLVITSVSASCGCTVPEKPEKPFAPGEEGVIKAKFDSKGRKGDARKAVYVEANTSQQHYELNFHVDVTE